MMMQRHVFISGTVQGVFFRDFVKQKANEFNVFGWVKNISDGRVEGVFVGEEEDVDRLVEECRTGPPHAEVVEIEVLCEYPGQFESFEIRQ